MPARGEWIDTKPRDRRQSLANRLRTPELWPKDFRWDFTKSRRCAIGLMYESGLVEETGAEEIADVLEMNLYDVYSIFGITRTDVARSYGFLLSLLPWLIRPIAVAKRLETYSL
jgi:hypothetical protein